jgi:hypothetical protein
MININELTEADKKREVRYISFGKTELGYITSWNELYIFVRYHTKIITDGEIQRVIARTGFTSEATDPKDLQFV